MKMRLIVFVTGFLVLALPMISPAQDSSAIYLKRAESLYATIWNLYRTPAYPGLFTAATERLRW